ncbi:iron complex transport system permease protein [Vibrio crassostreae]|uniref:Putative ABC-type Fe3+-siderophore transport system, permease component n=1 Tax=Vibrio crassostreae TaxID=246167 RepID=A0A822N0L0_9VIBR|nr:iron ABC transporter permease [Vibrio crassostreae]MDH5951645.1 iron ABC transporter permease [Vibrio crassostreae]TCN04925.1 iron complex transport system permease protein [Vibrio crassostreae]TCU06717.1 iron complex transport system permease protein [Vibrio crassostreae]CAK2108140.1 iron complex transport system permease protein [Vibrio crassostreae]CAK2887599.1 iron complex transport system permease protein [Vibrio crassostreae]
MNESIKASSDLNHSSGAIYQRMQKQRIKILLGTFLATSLSALFDLGTGSSWLGIEQVVEALLGGPSGDRLSTLIVWQLRLPITLTCLMVGASLGLAGGLMQTLLANPLASPYTLGISAAAGFGAAMAFLTGFSVFGLHWLGVPFAAFLTSGLASMAIYIIGRSRHMDAKILILAGIVVLFFFQALQSLIQYLASPEVLQQIVFWLFGSLLKASWLSFFVSGAVFLFGLVFALSKVWALTALTLGEERALALGIKTSKLRLQMFLLCSLLTAGAVSFVGTIGFIGLVAPHLARMLIGEDQRFYLPLAALMGAVLLCTSSLVAKLIVPGTIIPIGIVTSLVGVPILLYFLVSKRFV